MYMGFRAHNSLSGCQEELERAVKFTLPPPFYFAARILLYRPVHRTNKKSTSRWKVRNTRLRYIKTTSDLVQWAVAIPWSWTGLEAQLNVLGTGAIAILASYVERRQLHHAGDILAFVNFSEAIKGLHYQIPWGIQTKPMQECKVRKS
jgi:hypothetical protein